MYFITNNQQKILSCHYSIILQEESSLGARKDLDMLHGAEFAAVVLDDKYEAWPKAARTNVIKV